MDKNDNKVIIFHLFYVMAIKQIIVLFIIVKFITENYVFFLL